MRPLSTVSAALLGTIAMAPAMADRYERQPGVAVDHYVFNVEFADNSRAIKGETVTTVRFTAGGITRISFDLQSPKADGTGMTVAAVSEEGGGALRFEQTNDRLAIRLARPSTPGDVRVFHIRYAGQPTDGLRFGTSRSGQRGAFTWNWPTLMRDWAPIVDHISSKATSEFIVTAPEPYSVVANGLRVSEVSLGDGRKVTHWRQGVPISPWLNALGVARMQVYHGGAAQGVPLQIWAPAGTRVNVANGFLVARRAINLFGELVGPYPFEKLGQVVAPFGGGGMEHASVIFYGDGGARDGGPPLPPRPARAQRADLPAMSHDGLLSHEIAHQWFGDSVTEATWGDVWLSEGFATYFSDLYTEHFDGRDAFVASLRSERDGALSAERRERIPVIGADDEAAGPHLTQVQYRKGGWVLHMLRQQMTSPAFFKAIRLYYDRHKGGHATTEDLRATMEEVSGQQLGWFFDQWLTRVDSPRLAVTWRYDARARAVRVTATQTQPGDPYRLPIELGLADAVGGALRTSTVTMDRKAQEFTIAAPTRPAELVLDPETRLLADMTLTPR
ncbi:M1 family metallopeptidase [Sphingomonas quercus]|uniref:DUF3458 domain-containing protein n=1 Tax=Sphingomonas quercus TaxID=2842451 RepID=A0ABS6BEV3_9SPHN|nr:M1 family metallopeptidase [Sphingomonas quercus]MBU3076833.1 DUF3458 domain-containing protein [Sphingomonas quercus]